MTTKCAGTVAQLLSWSLLGHIRASKRGDPDAQKSFHATMASLLRMGEVPGELLHMLDQLAAGKDSADATHTKKPPNSSPLTYRDARIVAEVKVLAMFRDWVAACRTEWEAQGHEVPTMPETMKAIFAAIAAQHVDLTADRVKDIWKKRDKE